MNKKIKQQKGITLVSLVITIVVILILTVTIVLNTRTTSKVQTLTALRSDISNLTQKISDFYNEYGEIPGDIEYTNIGNIKGVLNSIEKSGSSKFYVIDLQAMKGVSLNYGNDYELVKNTNTATANTYDNLYIVNGETHNVFYVRGITVEENGLNKTYYTSYDKAEEVPTI